MKSVLKYIFIFAVIVLTLFLTGKKVAADTTPEAPRAFRVVVSWEEGNVSKFQEYKTFALAAVPAPSTDPGGGANKKILTLNQVGDGSVSGKLGTDVKISTNSTGQTDTFDFDKNDSVVLEATHANSTLTWTGCSSNTDTCTVTMSDNMTVTATFVPDGNNPASYNLIVNQTGTGQGSVTSDVGDINTSFSTKSDNADFASDTQVTLTAVSPNGSAPVVWGNCDSIPVATQCKVTMDNNKTVTADFALAPDKKTLTVIANGVGFGGVVSAPQGTNPPGITINKSTAAEVSKNTTFDTGTSVTLTAAAGANSHFHSWTGDPACNGSTLTTCTIAMTGNKTIYADFGATTCNGVQIYKEKSATNHEPVTTFRCLPVGDYDGSYLNSIGYFGKTNFIAGIGRIDIPAGHSVQITEDNNLNNLSSPFYRDILNVFIDAEPIHPIHSIRVR